MILKRIETSKESKQRFAQKQDVILTKNYDVYKPHIVINDKQTYQTWIGFGGAFTESAAYTLNQMPKHVYQEAIEAYFGKDGLGYTMGRTHIHSCDFALENYTYVQDNDQELKTFDMSREDQWVVPMIKEAMRHQKDLKLFATPWSPPAWMKTNNEMNHGGKLLPEFRQAWSNYYIKYLEHMELRGIPFWGLTVQNEPEATQTWDSCIYTAEEERDFVKNYLGPTLEKSKFDVKLLGWDHNRDVIVERASILLNDPEANKFFWGIGNHWYVSEAFENLSVVHELFPDKHLIFTEGSQEGGPKPGAWFTGERYARNIIGDMNNFLEGWIDWNMVLNEEGGPNHVGNYCDAAILADRKNKQLIFNSSYYYIGHFSKYIKPGAKRIDVKQNLGKGCHTTAFINVDGSIVLVILNESDEKKDITVVNQNLGATISVESHSIITLISSH